MARFLMKPKVDFAFKEIMADEKARAGFLSAILKIRPEEVQQTRVLNSSLRRGGKDEKQGILDVRVRLGDGTEADIEIQLAPLKVWADRALFYLAKMYVGQIAPGQDYSVFKKCVSVSVLDFTLFPGEKGFYSSFHIREDARHFIYTDKIEFHVIELPKLPKGLPGDAGGVELWARFINAEREEEFEMLAKKDPHIASAYRQLQAISQDKGKRLEYEARQKALWDHNQMVQEAERRGEERGEKRVNQLNAFLIKTKRFEDLERSVNDGDFQRRLMDQYGI